MGGSVEKVAKEEESLLEMSFLYCVKMKSILKTNKKKNDKNGP